MKTNFSIKKLIFVSSLLPSLLQSVDGELIHKNNIPTVINQIIKGFFGWAYYQNKDACARGALYSVEHECLDYYDYAPRKCIKDKTLNRIVQNVKTTSMEMARKLVTRDKNDDAIVEAVGRTVQSEIENLIYYSSNGYQDVFEDFIKTPVNGKKAYTFSEKIQLLVDSEKELYAPKPTCSVTWCDAPLRNLIKLPCKDYICVDCLLKINSACQEAGRNFKCPRCSNSLTPKQLQKLLDEYYTNH